MDVHRETAPAFRNVPRSVVSRAQTSLARFVLCGSRACAYVSRMFLNDASFPRAHGASFGEGASGIQCPEGNAAMGPGTG